MALLMVPGSRITPSAIVDALNHCKRLPPWMATVFYVGKPATIWRSLKSGKPLQGLRCRDGSDSGSTVPAPRTPLTSGGLPPQRSIILSSSTSVLRPDVKDAWPGNFVKLKEPQPGGGVKEVSEFEPINTVNTEGNQTLGLTAMSAQAGRDLTRSRRSKVSMQMRG